MSDHTHPGSHPAPPRPPQDDTALRDQIAEALAGIWPTSMNRNAEYHRQQILAATDLVTAKVTAIRDETTRQQQHADQLTVIRPGQTLIVRYTRRTITDYEADQLRAKFTERLPGVNILIIGADIEPVMIYDPEPTD